MNDNYSSLEQGYKGLFDVKMSEVLGGSGTAQNQCMCYVVEQFMKELHKFTESVFLYCYIESLPDRLLDYLATEWDLPYYDDSLDRETRVLLVKEGFNWRRTAGTVHGVEYLVKQVLGEGIVKEWYEYDGEPGMFKVQTTAKTEDMAEFFRTLLVREKNARSHLEAVELGLSMELPMFMGINTRTRYTENPIIKMITN